jgi:hypothetical protein
MGKEGKKSKGMWRQIPEKGKAPSKKKPKKGVPY